MTGDVPLSAAQISAVLDSFIGEGSLITLQQATEELENALKLAGFELHRITLVPQDLGGLVKRYAAGSFIEGQAEGVVGLA